MNLLVVQNVVLLEKHKITEAVMAVSVNNAKCSIQYVANVVKIHKFLSNQQKVNLFSVAIASKHIKVINYYGDLLGLLFNCKNKSCYTIQIAFGL